MLAGLTIAFFMSHQRIWLVINKDNILLAGSSNKNKPAFTTTFNKISAQISTQFEAL